MVCRDFVFFLARISGVQVTGLYEVQAEKTQEKARTYEDLQSEMVGPETRNPDLKHLHPRTRESVSACRWSYGLLTSWPNLHENIHIHIVPAQCLGSAHGQKRSHLNFKLENTHHQLLSSTFKLE